MKDFTDYHAYSFKRVTPALKFSKSMLQLLPLGLSLYALAHVLIDQITTDPALFYRIPITRFYRASAIIIIISLILGIHRIRKALEPHITIFELNKQGLHINNRTVPYTKINARAMLAELQKNPPRLTIPGRFSKHTIKINDNEQREAIITALDHYTKTS